MKTIIRLPGGNNVQKTVLRSAAILASLILISFTVAAQGYWKQLLANNSFTRIASTLVENPSSASQHSNPEGKSQFSGEDFDFVAEKSNSLLEIGSRASGIWLNKALTKQIHHSGME